MSSFGHGGRSVPASSIAEGLAIVRELDRLDARRERIEMLKSINHGHDFGYNLVCQCGLREIDYREWLFFSRNEDDELCELCPVASR